MKPLLVGCRLGMNQDKSWWACDAQVKERYMNEQRSHSNKSNPKNIMIKKSLKELRVNPYTKKVQFFFFFFF